ncbi:TetR family transcriptional regulator [Promicromonospora sp. AC04]|uniref:TetR/AcrR family transcriptional regulator n=1 Tax=Promicromonospora sp. AC04 TaxID=2135723 RepID=UPI000D3946D7|nr:TetR/AcrR family transcriptional regulator [Promicromonospora sp. AC04]PUB32128.1 TetR family transcriptional regulator [Promicromonospora sp. AC04]
MPHSDDLTARARIRDAALAEFGTQGIAGATIRGIAKRAGVSPALVQHHFGTKEGLRAACDDHVLEYYRSTTETAFERGHISDSSFLAKIYDSSQPVLDYLARALVDGTPAAATVFDEMVNLTERYFADRPGLADARTRAIVYTSMRLGGLVLHQHVARLLDVESITDAGPQLGRATLDVVSPDILPDGVADQIRKALDNYEKEEDR